MGKVIIPNTNLVIPYKPTPLEEYLEMKLAEAGFPLSEAELDFEDDPIFAINRETKKNNKEDKIIYIAEYYCEEFIDVKSRIVICENLLKKISGCVDNLRVYLGKDFETSFRVDDFGEKQFKVDPEYWHFKEGDLPPKHDLEVISQWSDFQRPIDRVVATFASGNYDLGYELKEKTDESE